MPRDPNIFIDLTKARSEFEAEVIVQALESQGIPAKTFGLADAVLQWRGPWSNSVRIAVPRRDVDAARRILAEIRADAASVDWTAVDTGDTTPLTPDELAGEWCKCAVCGYDLEGLDQPEHCPECGADLAGLPPETGMRRARSRTWKDKWRAAIATLVLLVGVIAVGAALYWLRVI